MTIFEQTFRDLLIQTNLCGSRVFLMRAPQVPNAKLDVPYMVFFMVGTLPSWSMTGPLDLQKREYQISIFDTSQTRALAVADSLRARLDTYTGWFENVYFGSCFHVLQTWMYEEETALFQIVQEYRIQFRLDDVASIRSKQPQYRKELP